MAPRVIFWHRTDLRLHDNIALQAALDLEPECLWPMFVFDPHYVYNQIVGINRYQILLDSLEKLSENYTKVNSKSQLFLPRGPPQTLLPALCKAWKVTHLVFEEDDDDYTIRRDKEVSEALEKIGVKVISKIGHTLFDAKQIIAKHKGTPPTSYGPFVKIIEALPPPPRPIPAPTTIPDPGSVDVSHMQRKDHPIDKENDVNKPIRYTEDYLYDTFSGPDKDFATPKLESLGFNPATTHHRGGEDEALRILDDWLVNRKKEILNFEKPKTNPAEFDPKQTTTLSPHLKFGTLSVRKFYWELKDLLKGTKHTEPPVSLIGQLYWREFFHCANAGTPNFQRMRGNKVCRYIDWKLQNQYDEEGHYLPRTQLKFDDKEAEEHFAAWSEGRTGFPWIEWGRYFAICDNETIAGFTNNQHVAHCPRIETGWIHHLARHSVACFLTRGHLYISWERGAEVFDKYLLDWDPSLNAGNWMWLSASAFFSQISRVYSPIAFGKKWDKTGKLIRKFCPELKNIPDKYIYEPWLCPIADQKKAGCIIGTDYPKRIVDEKEARTECLAKMNAAYKVHLYGNDPAVHDGSAALRFGSAENSENSKRKAESDSGEDERKPAAKVAKRGIASHTKNQPSIDSLFAKKEKE